MITGTPMEDPELIPGLAARGVPSSSLRARHLGANVYLWDRPEQNRFLTRCLQPALRELRREGRVQRFWFDRFDARGPHLFLLFAVLPGSFSPLRDELADRWTVYLRESPAAPGPAPDEIAERHRQTRGGKLCAADALPGLAENHSFLLFEQSAEGYPFGRISGQAAMEDLWWLLDALSLWALEEVERRAGGVPTAAAVRWMAALDRALRARGAADEYWRYHAATLLPGLGESRDGREIERLGQRIGAESLRLFSRLWEGEPAEARWPDCSRLVDLAFGDRRERPCFPALRQIVHSTWKQLGLRTSQEIPLVLFAWAHDHSALMIEEGE